MSEVPMSPAGVDPVAGTRCVLDMPGPRWFAPGDPVWRVHDDPATAIGVAAGVFMLASHPAYAAMFLRAGVDRAPWDLERMLLDQLSIVTYGTVDDAAVAIERGRMDRSRHVGTTEHGEHYYGTDPELMGWGHAAATWAMISAHQRFSPTPLTAQESEVYVVQCARTARLQGVTAPPRSVRELERLLRRRTGVVRATRAGRRIARALGTTAHPCRAGVDDAAQGDHVRCETVVAAAVSVLPGDVSRALGIGPRPREWRTETGRIAAAHRGLGAPPITTQAPIAAPSALSEKIAGTAGRW